MTANSTAPKAMRWKQRFQNYERALGQLRSAVELARERALSDLERQGLVQGFEMVHELSWNVLKDLLEYEGIVGIVGSRGAVREAFKRGLLRDGEVWMDMIDKRNLSSHTYNQQIAEALARSIVDEYLPAFLELQRALSNRAEHG